MRDEVGDGSPDDFDRYVVPGLKRGISILMLFDQHRTSLSLAEIARQIGAPRSSTFRLVYTLESLGLLERISDTKNYRLASRILSLGVAFLSSVEVVDVARELLDELRFRSRLSTLLAIRDQTEIVHVLRMSSLQPYTSNVQVGTRRPAHAAPMGRLLLCELSDQELDLLYPTGFLPQVTPVTAATLNELKVQLAEDRDRGYIVSHGTFTPTGCSIAAPVRDNTGAIVAAINVGGPRDLWVTTREAEDQLRDDVVATAREISRRMGFQADKSRRAV